MQHPDGLLARVLRGRRREGAHARHQRHLLRRERRVAPLPLHRRHRIPRGRCSRSSSARSTSRSTTSTRPARSSGTPTRSASTARARCSPVRRASTRRCAARSRPPSGSVANAPTGSSRSVRSRSRSRTAPSASSTRNAGRWTGTTRSSPACCAATRPKRASRRKWDTFVAPGRGVRCVSDQPWITAAETCELVMALDAIGLHDRARELFAWVQFLRHDDGSYWTGMNFDDDRFHEPGDYFTRRAAHVEQRGGRARGQRARRLRPDRGTVPRRRPPGRAHRAGAHRSRRRDREHPLPPRSLAARIARRSSQTARPWCRRQ